MTVQARHVAALAAFAAASVVTALLTGRRRRQQEEPVYRFLKRQSQENRAFHKQNQPFQT